MRYTFGLIICSHTAVKVVPPSSLIAATLPQAWLLAVGEDYTNNNQATSRACGGAN